MSELATEAITLEANAFLVEAGNTKSRCQQSGWSTKADAVVVAVDRFQSTCQQNVGSVEYLELQARRAARRSHCVSGSSSGLDSSDVSEGRRVSDGLSSCNTDRMDGHVLLPRWTLTKDDIRRCVAACASPSVGNEPSSCSDEDTLVLKESHGVWRPFIAFPGSPARLAWDFLGAGFIFYDLVAIPLEVFDPLNTFFTECIEWLSLIFWTINIFASLSCGYVKDGVTVMIPWKIAVQYCRSWFLIDLLVVVPDWAARIAALSGDKSNGGNSVRLLGGLRLIRMMRLLRLLKLRRILATVSDQIDSEYVSISANIGKMLLLLLMINHVICCAWYWLGKERRQGGDPSWITRYELEENSWQTAYCISFHWSITQFTPATMEVHPQNFEERFFAIAIVVFALVGFSYVVGSITGSLMQLRSLSNNATQQFWNLRRYLRQHKVPTALSFRIQKYLEHAWQNQHSKSSLKDVKIIELLSERLLSELQCELFVPHLNMHPLFARLNVVSRISMHRLANAAISWKSLARSDSLFILGERATHMSVVVHGCVSYNHLDSEGEEHAEKVNNSDEWISEPVLWTTSYSHRGTLNAVTECDLILMSPQHFGEVISLNPISYAIACTYAHNLVTWLNDQPLNSLSDVWQGARIGFILIGFMQLTDVALGETESRSILLLGRSRRQRSKALSNSLASLSK